MSLTCGGRGPCCHVGYAHRHCEHCDTVIPISVQPHTHYPTFYGSPSTHPWYSGSGIYSTFGYAQQINPIANQLQGFFNSQALQSATEVPIDAGQQSSST